jgi:hypothetical protein
LIFDAEITERCKVISREVLDDIGFLITAYIAIGEGDIAATINSS